MLNKLLSSFEQRQVLYAGRDELSVMSAEKMFARLKVQYYTNNEKQRVIAVLLNNAFIKKDNGEYVFIYKRDNEPESLLRMWVRSTVTSSAGLLFGGILVIMAYYSDYISNIVDCILYVVAVLSGSGELAYAVVFALFLLLFYLGKTVGNAICKAIVGLSGRNKMKRG